MVASMNLLLTPSVLGKLNQEAPLEPEPEQMSAHSLLLLITEPC